jgi:hypothetical protein
LFEFVPTFVDPFIHWKLLVPLPVAVTLKFNALPAQIVVLAVGCTVILVLSSTPTLIVSEVTVVAHPVNGVNFTKYLPPDVKVFKFNVVDAVVAIGVVFPTLYHSYVFTAPAVTLNAYVLPIHKVSPIGCVVITGHVDLIILAVVDVIKLVHGD